MPLDLLSLIPDLPVAPTAKQGLIISFLQPGPEWWHWAGHWSIPDLLGSSRAVIPDFWLGGRQESAPPGMIPERNGQQHSRILELLRGGLRLVIPVPRPWEPAQAATVGVCWFGFFFGRNKTFSFYWLFISFAFA